MSVARCGLLSYEHVDLRGLVEDGMPPCQETLGRRRPMDRGLARIWQALHHRYLA